MKWLVYAFYPHLGIPVRVLDFNQKDELIDYVRGLRMCDTAYAVQDVTNRSNPKTIDLMTSDEVGRDEMAQMLKEWAERKEECTQ